MFKPSDNWSLPGTTNDEALAREIALHLTANAAACAHTFAVPLVDVMEALIRESAFVLAVVTHANSDERVVAAATDGHAIGYRRYRTNDI